MDKKTPEIKRTEKKEND